MAAKITKRERKSQKSQKALERMLLGLPEHQQGANGRCDDFYWDEDSRKEHNIFYQDTFQDRGGNKKKGGRVKWER